MNIMLQDIHLHLTIRCDQAWSQCVRSRLFISGGPRGEVGCSVISVQGKSAWQFVITLKNHDLVPNVPDFEPGLVIHNTDKLLIP